MISSSPVSVTYLATGQGPNRIGQTKHERAGVSGFAEFEQMCTREGCGFGWQLVWVNVCVSVQRVVQIADCEDLRVTQIHLLTADTSTHRRYTHLYLGHLRVLRNAAGTSCLLTLTRECSQ